MSENSRIRDNNMYGTVANFLKDKIQDGASLSFVSAVIYPRVFDTIDRRPEFGMNGTHCNAVQTLITLNLTNPRLFILILESSMRGSEVAMILQRYVACKVPTFYPLMISDEPKIVYPDIVHQLL